MVGRKERGSIYKVGNKKLLTVGMAPINNAFPKSFWVLVLVFQVVESDYSVTVEPQNKSLVICELDQTDIECPPGSIIEVLDADYGRGDQTTCTKTTVQNCFAICAINVVRHKCEFRAECHLESKTEWFGDPCPGVAKYLTVDYKCNEGVIVRNEIVCDGYYKTLKCPEKRTLRIFEANYGRKNKTICLRKGNVQCTTNSVLELVKERCESKRQCDIESSSHWLGDLCPGTSKYLSVEFSCEEEK